MRSIKFRAWDKETDEGMSEPFTIGDIAQGYDCNYNVDFPFDVAYEGIFMQYTGLKDKTGKEIYEGDILRHVGHELNKALAPVEFRRGTFTFADGGNLGQNGSENYEVIGNIYENPELLEAEESHHE